MHFLTNCIDLDPDPGDKMNTDACGSGFTYRKCLTIVQAEAGLRGEECGAEQGQDHGPVEEHPQEGQDCRPQEGCRHTQG